LERAEASGAILAMVDVTADAKGRQRMARDVLIIDDEASLARNIKAYLEEDGFRALVAEDGEAGLELFERLGADVVLLDLHLPGMDGWAVLQRLRARSPSAKVVIMTAHGDPEAAARAHDRGACGYLSKPVRLGELTQVIRRCLR
jgi:DNA-binding response OmpR family regulator